MVKHAAVCLAIGLSVATEAVGDVFTWQGKLVQSGIEAGGIYDFRFRLYENPVGPPQEGLELVFNDMVVTDGLVTVTMDFGAGTFPGAPRWLEVDVKEDAAGAYQTLSPRLPVHPTPYAHHAFSADAAASVPDGGLPSTYSGAIGFSNPGNQFAGNGSGLTKLNATELATGNVSAARMPTGGTWTLSGPLTTSLGPNMHTIFATGDTGLNIINNGSTGLGDGIRAETLGEAGRGVWGRAQHPDSGVGVVGSSEGETGIGVLGFGESFTGINVGVYGDTASSDGYAAFFAGRTGVGNGGFGPPDPLLGGMLEINGTGADFGLVLRGSNPNQRGIVIDDGAVSWMIRNSNGDFAVSVSNPLTRTPFQIDELAPSDSIFVDAGGKVGLGTMTPTQRLDVFGTVRAAGGVEFGDGTTQTTAFTGSGTIINAGFVSGLVGALPGAAVSWAFAGPTTSITVDGTQRIIAHGAVPLGYGAGAATSGFRVDVCYQLNGVGAISNFSAVNYMICQATPNTRQTYAVSASSVLPAGTYLVGIGVYNFGAETLDDNDYVNLSYMVIQQ